VSDSTSGRVIKISIHDCLHLETREAFKNYIFEFQTNKSKVGDTRMAIFQMQLLTALTISSPK